VISVFHDLLFQPAIFPLLVIAGATERVRLGPAALNPSTLHPVELAGQAAALDLASGGRAYLGLVTGAWLDRLGLDGRAPVARMREAVEIVRRLFDGDRSGFAGSHFSLAPGVGFEYEPLRPRDELVTIFQNCGRHAVVLHGAATAIRIRPERCRPGCFELAARRHVCLQVQHIVGYQREEQIARVEPDTAEHPLRRDGANGRQLLEHELNETLGDRHG